MEEWEREEKRSFPFLSVPVFYLSFPRTCLQLASMGGMPGQATRQKAGRPAWANANVSFVFFLLRFFRALSISVQGNGVCSRVPKGASGVVLASMGGMPGQVTRQKAARLDLVNASVSLVCCLLRFYLLLSIFMQGNGVCSGVSKGADDVLLASMGRMSDWATCQKAFRLALAKANVPLYDFSFIFLFFKHFLQANGGCSGVCNGASSVPLASSCLPCHNDCF